MLADPRLDDYKVIKDERTRKGEGIRIANNSGTLTVVDDPSDAVFAFIPQDGVEETPPEFPKRTTGTEKVIIDRARFERLIGAATQAKRLQHILHERFDYIDEYGIPLMPGDLDPIP